MSRHVGAMSHMLERLFLWALRKSLIYNPAELLQKRVWRHGALHVAPLPLIDVSNWRAEASAWSFRAKCVALSRRASFYPGAESYEETGVGRCSTGVRHPRTCASRITGKARDIKVFLRFSEGSPHYNNLDSRDMEPSNESAMASTSPWSGC